METFENEFNSFLDESWSNNPIIKQHLNDIEQSEKETVQKYFELLKQNLITESENETNHIYKTFINDNLPFYVSVQNQNTNEKILFDSYKHVRLIKLTRHKIKVKYQELLYQKIIPYMVDHANDIYQNNNFNNVAGYITAIKKYT